MTFAKLEALRLDERIADRQAKVQRRHEEVLKNPEIRALRRCLPFGVTDP
jgi:hypothetical protein